MGTNRYDGESIFFDWMSRIYITTKTGGVVPPCLLDIHPVSGECNNDCVWCIGRAQRTSISALRKKMNASNVVSVLERIFSPRWTPLWPREIHFCGNDSEPTLSDATKPGIQYLLKKPVVVELITNGLKLDDNDLAEAVSQIHKLSISLDVTNNNDYTLYKRPRTDTGVSIKDGYDIVINNLRSIVQRRAKHNSPLHISVTFVATRKTYRTEEWKSCFKDLREIGVQNIRVRDDLHAKEGVHNLQSEIAEMNRQMNGIDIAYISPEEPYTDFRYCYGPRIWPALGADCRLYACAHVANSDFTPFGDLLRYPSLMELYQAVFYPPNPPCPDVQSIGNCQRKCPSMLGRYNEPALAKRRLTKTALANERDVRKCIGKTHSKLFEEYLDMLLVSEECGCGYL